MSRDVLDRVDREEPEHDRDHGYRNATTSAVLPVCPTAPPGHGDEQEHDQRDRAAHRGDRRSLTCSDDEHQSPSVIKSPA